MEHQDERMNIQGYNLKEEKTEENNWAKMWMLMNVKCNEVERVWMWMTETETETNGIFIWTNECMGFVFKWVKDQYSW